MLGPQSIDSSRVYEIALAGRDGSLAGVFDGTETFATKLWTGDDQPSLADLSPRWATADDGMEFTGNPAGLESPVLLLPVEAAGLTTLAPGLYRVRILINPGVDDVEAFLDLIEFTAAAGSATPPKVYGSFDDLRKLAPWIGELITADPSLQSDLGEQRELARARLDDAILAHYQPYADLGISGRSFFGFGGFVTEAINTPSSWLREQLDADRLMVDGSRGRVVKEIVSRLAIGFACEPQLGTGPGDTSYQVIAHRMFAKANALMCGYTAEIDTNGDGQPDLWVPLGVINCR